MGWGREGTIPPPASIGGLACREGVWEMEFPGKHSPGPVGRSAAPARAQPRLRAEDARAAASQRKFPQGN